MKTGDAVRMKNGAKEMTVREVRGGEIHCVWFAEDDLWGGSPEDAWCEHSMLEIAWVNDGKHVPREVGSVVQLASGGAYMTLGPTCGEESVCSWFSGPHGDLHSERFFTKMLCRVKPSCGLADWAKSGDRVQLRTGGPVMTVLHCNGADVHCRLGANLPAFDSRMLLLEYSESASRTTRDLVEFAAEQGLDLARLCSHGCFFIEGRGIWWWRLTTNGPLHYSYQGWIDVMCHAAGIRNESGRVPDLASALRFTAAWLLDQTVLEELPEREVMRWYGPRLAVDLS